MWRRGPSSPGGGPPKPSTASPPPETKHPTYFQSIGLPLEPPLVATLRRHDLDRRNAPVFVQSFEDGNLRALHSTYRLRARLVFLAGGPTPLITLVVDAHAAGLVVHPWTFRAENAFLPANLRVGTDPNAWGKIIDEIRTFIGTGIDGFFTDQTDVSVVARDLS